jgi:hypothetical protein
MFSEYTIFLGICTFVRMLIAGIVAVALVKTPCTVDTRHQRLPSQRYYVYVETASNLVVQFVLFLYHQIEGVSRSFLSSRVQFLYVTFGSDINYNNWCIKLFLHVCSVTFLYFTSQAVIILRAPVVTVVFVRMFCERSRYHLHGIQFCLVAL